jgi:hypothetical protein
MKGYTAVIILIGLLIISVFMQFPFAKYITLEETYSWSEIPYSVAGIVCSLGMDEVYYKEYRDQHPNVDSANIGDAVFNVAMAADPDSSWYLHEDTWQTLLKTVEETIGLNVDISIVDLDPNNTDANSPTHLYRHFDGYNSQYQKWGLDNQMLIQVYFKDTNKFAYWWISWAIIKVAETTDADGNTIPKFQCKVVVR